MFIFYLRGIQGRKRFTGRSLNIRTTLKLCQGNVCVRMVSEWTLYKKKFNWKITAKKFDSKIFKIGDPMGLRLNMAVFEIFQCVKPVWMTRIQTFFLRFDESWVNLSSQGRNHDLEVLNQSISVQGTQITRRPNIRTSHPMHGSFQPLVFREDFTQINCSQSVKRKIWCCKEICQTYTTRDICWYRFGY